MSSNRFKIAVLVLAFGCATKPAKNEDEPVGESSSGKAGSDQEAGDSNVDVDKDFSQFTSSLSNESLSGKSIDRSDAEAMARSLEATVKSEPKRENYLALISSRRLAGQSYESVIDAAGKLADVEMRKNIDRSIPTIAKLEIAIAAVRAKNVTMAEHFLPSILESKTPDIRAAGHTLVGIIEYMEGKTPEAVDSWLKARKEKDKYQAATYNLAVIALKYGAYKFADGMLGDLDGNWLVLTGKATVDRLSNNGKGANENCQRALDAKKNKLTLYNCALVEYLPGENSEKAKQMLNDASSMKGGNSAFDKQIASAIDKVGKSRGRAEPEGNAAKKENGKGEKSGKK